jgi:Na+:H+ antiporter, NhaA family
MPVRLIDTRFFPKGESPGKAIVEPFQRFAAIQASSGILLLMVTLISLGLANKSFTSFYHDLFHTQVTVGIGGHTLVRSIHFGINEGLMTIFFFMVGLEIDQAGDIGW